MRDSLGSGGVGNRDNQVKVQLSGPEGEVETLWAFPLGDDLYELDNTPWYAYRVSWHDIIEARPQEADGFPEFVKVVRKSGYRTVRLILDPPADKDSNSQAILDRLIQLGCSYEGANPAYIAIDIPPATDLDQVCQFLTTTEQQWEHADPPYEDLHPGDAPAA
jgi:uncharacterized protein DUF4265